MSLCYDFQKWTLLTLSSIALAMIVGLVLMQYANGQTSEFDPLLSKCIIFQNGQLAILSLGSLDDNLCNQQDGLKTLEYFVAQGFEIKSTEKTSESLETIVYLQK